MYKTMLLHKYLFLTVMFFTFSVMASAQNCDCENNFAWLKKTFEENDAGAQYAINKKGQAAYDIHNQLISEKIKSATDIYDCRNILNEWLRFFRSGHLGIGILPEAIKETQNEEIIEYEIVPDWETVAVDTVELKKYLDNKQDFDFEGIWANGDYKIGVKKIDNQYIGFIINSIYKDWTEGQVKFKILADSVIYYMRNRSIEIGNPVLASKNFLYLITMDTNFERIYPVYKDNFLQSLVDRKPYLKTIDNKTFYLRIPSFRATYKSQIDSTIYANFDKIVSTENLIIDLRYNTGGSDVSWMGLLPILYTNTIRTRGVEYLSTEFNIPNILDNIWDDFAEEWQEQTRNKLKDRIGQFVNLNNVDVITTAFDTIYSFPRNIAVIVNNYCASSTEQSLLAAKQSRKVKVFGTTTAGALDFANMYSVKSPNNEFQLHYALTKDIGIDNFPIDDIGIQPDFYLDSEIPEYKWIEYVSKILNN